ncbi:MAG: ThiF family adenylyltransferase [Patescibacteria group bacterium]
MTRKEDVCDWQEYDPQSIFDRGSDLKEEYLGPRVIDLTDPFARTRVIELFQKGEERNMTFVDTARSSTTTHIGQLFPREMMEAKKSGSVRALVAQKCQELGINLNIQGLVVEFPYTNTAQKYAPKEIHYAARTDRNRGLFSPEMQAQIRDFPVAFAGLSVGSSGLMTWVTEGGMDVHGLDSDTIETANLNRIGLPANYVGRTKAFAALSECRVLDPYGNYNISPEAVTKENVEAFLSRRKVVVEETDSVPTKDLIRYWAQKLGIDVVSVADTGLGHVVVDVEPYRSDPENAKPYHGLLERNGWTQAQWEAMPNPVKIAAIIGIQNVPYKMLVAFEKLLHGEIQSFPQPRSTVALAGSTISHVLKRLAWGEPVPNRTIISLDEKLDTHFVEEEEMKKELANELATLLHLPLE